jgi:hypothetical protein
MPVNTMDILIARGVLKPGRRTRVASPPAAGRRGPPALTIDEIRQALKTYLEPYLKG